MPYIGHAPTNSGNFYILDDFNGLGQDGSSSTYDQNANGTIVNFKLMVAGVAITPNVDNLIVTIDGVLQHPTDAYTISGSILTFTGAPASGVDFHVFIMGQSSTVGEGSIGADELQVSGDGTNNQLLKSDGDGTMSWINQNTVTASTAATLATARAINGVNFDGSAAITVTADANTLSNTTLKSTVVSSSLTSVGTLTGLTVSGNITTTGTGSDIITGDYLYLDAADNSAAKNLVFRKNDDTWLGQIEFHPTATAQIVTRVNTALALGVNNSQKMTIGTDGNTTFAGNITTTGSSITVDPPSGDAVLALQHSSQTLRIDQNSIRTTTNSALNLFTNNTNGSGMYIATDGNIGFNQTTPRAVNGYRLLTVNHATNGAGINFQQNGTNYGTIYNVASDMYYDADTHHIFRTGGAMGGTTRFRINSTGFVGIGASPNALLDINKSTTDANAPTASESYEGFRLILANPQLTNNATNALGFSMYNGEVCASIDASTLYNGNYETTLRFQTRKDGAGGLTEKMRISPDGKVGIGCTPVSPLHLFGDSVSALFKIENDHESHPQGFMLQFPSASPDNNTQEAFKFSDNANNRCIIWSDGDVNNSDNAYGSLSDARAKQGIRDANSQWDDIKAIKVRNFKKTEDVLQYGDKAWEQIGVVAQELEESGMDKLVREHPADEFEIAQNEDINEGDMVKSVVYSIIYMKAIKALQEAMERIEALENA